MNKKRAEAFCAAIDRAHMWKRIDARKMQIRNQQHMNECRRYCIERETDTTFLSIYTNNIRALAALKRANSIIREMTND